MIAGVDEVGRGALIGDVVSCALILSEHFPLQILNDSKKLSPKKREHIATLLKQSCYYAIGRASPQEIDQINIHHATLLSMKRAIEALPVSPSEVWIDGKYAPTGLKIPAKTFIKGDGLHACISAASILAKTTRDAEMLLLGVQFPHLQLEKHKGYPTSQHLSALNIHGPTPLHRHSFKPVQATTKK